MRCDVAHHYVFFIYVRLSKNSSVVYHVCFTLSSKGHATTANSAMGTFSMFGPLRNVDVKHVSMIISDVHVCFMFISAVMLAYTDGSMSAGLVKRQYSQHSCG